MSKLSSNEILARLGRKGARAACEVCSVNDWIVVGDNGPQIMNMQFQSEVTADLVIGGGNIVPSVALACRNCGNMRFHAVGIIAPEVMKTDA